MRTIARVGRGLGGTIALLLAHGAYAAQEGFFTAPPDLGLPAKDLPGAILFIINFVLVLVGVLALAFLVYGGFKYITSRGDETEVEGAKSIITNAIIGIVVIGIAAAIVNFVIQAVTGGGVFGGFF